MITTSGLLSIPWPSLDSTPVVVGADDKQGGSFPRPRAMLRKKLVLIDASPPESVAHHGGCATIEENAAAATPAKPHYNCMVCGGIRKRKSSVFCDAACLIAYTKSHQIPDDLDPKFAKRYIRMDQDAFLRGISWEIPISDFVNYWGRPCHYCGGDMGDRIGLDRLDSTKSYHPSNVQPCCWICNMMKRTMGYEEFIRRCGLIYSRLSPGLPEFERRRTRKANHGATPSLFQHGECLTTGPATSPSTDA